MHTGLLKYLETWNLRNFEKKKEFLTLLICSVVKFQFDTKNISYSLKVFVITKFFRNTFKVALQYLFNVLYYLIHFLTLNLI